MVVVAPNANMNFMQGFSPAAAATMTAAVADLCASSGLGARADVVIVPAAKIPVGANRLPAPDADAAVGAVVDDDADDVVGDVVVDLVSPRTGPESGRKPHCASLWQNPHYYWHYPPLPSWDGFLPSLIWPTGR